MTNEAIKLAIEKGGYVMEYEPYESAWIRESPLFWQALGKALGWTIPVDPDWRRYNNTWQYHWHRYIDWIAEGKDADSFFKELIK